MHSVLRLVLGFRPDLSLLEKWWHRLAKVALVLLLVAVGAVTAPITYSAFEPELVLANIEILTTQRAFMDAADKREFNVTPQFLASPGSLGARRGDRVEWLYSGDVSKRTCTPDVYAHMTEVVDLLNSTPSSLPYQTVDSATELLGDAGVDVGESACLTPEDVTLPDPDNILKYRFKTATTAVRIAKATGITSAIMLALWVLVANLYYRGLVYVICGSRKKSDLSQA